MHAGPPSTRLELRFRVLGTRVRVHPLFWLVAALLGLRLPVAEQILWVGVVFISVLVHEMGHVLAARAIGRRGHVVLYSLGGLTVEEGTPGPGVWREGMVALAGPVAGSVLALLAYAGMPLAGPTHSGFLGALRFHLVGVNVAWTLLNLLPLYPLDGGRAMRRLCVSIGGDTGYAWSSIVSLITAGVAAVVSWRMSQPLLGVFMLYFAVQEWERSF